MRKLTESQIVFLLDKFFHHNSYAGYANIGRNLLEKGKCIVAGKDCIWRGGIGNFISTKPAEDAVDCTEYRFDIEMLLSSEWYLETYTSYIKNMRSEIDERVKLYDELIELK